QAGTDSAEFVELYDGGVGNTALDGLVLVLYNGSDDASYEAFDLDGQSTGADGYFVLCANAANTANCDLDVAPDTNLIQNGADAVALHTGDAADFPEDTPVTTVGLIDALVYDTNDTDDAGLSVLLNTGQPQVNEGGGGDAPGDSNQRCPNGSGGARNTDTYAQWQPTPGAENACEDPPAVINDRFIHEIQGPGLAVTEPGTIVRVRGVVVGDYQADDELDGFFLQEEFADEDADPATSEGIFIFCGSCSVAVAEGNVVEVVGVQEEFFDMSQIDVGAAGPDGIVVVIDSGDNSALVAAASVDLPAPASTTAEATFENVEGMLVTFTDILTATEYFELGRYGQVVLSEGGKLRQFTNDNVPTVAGFAAHLEEVAKRRIILDDINNFQNDDPVFHPQPGGFAVDNFIRGGDTIAALTGVMHWSWAGSGGTDAWRIRPQVDTPVVFNRSNPRDAAPDDVGGDIRVATLNVLNYFTTIDEGNNTCGPAAESCRGAHSEAERVRQLDKLIAALSGMDADVVGLVEIENNASESLESITAALSAATGEAWDYVDAGVTGGDVIKVGFIYNADTVTASGNFAVLDSSDFTDPNNSGQLRNRAALAETFTESVTGESFTAVVNHLKSKGSGCGSGDDDTTTGQGNCNVTRTLAAERLADWLATDPTGSGDPDVIVLGDLNAYAMEDPVSALKAGSDDTVGTADDYTDLVDEFIGATNAYSFVFSGEWGYLDHALANDSMAGQVTGVTHWHINADEVNLLDYNDTIQDENEASFEAKPGSNELYAPDAFRASDHDAVIVGLNLANPMGDKEDVIADLGALLPSGSKLTDKRLNKAIDHIEDSLEPAWWTSDQTVTTKNVFDAERRAVAQLRLIVNSGGPEAEAALSAILALVNADRQLAQIELISAIDRGGKASKIAAAQEAMADAAAYAAAGQYVRAVNAYKAAWDAATKA
ncbi:MAG: ExeM/NucH family extracellular endonuclease, partial [Acidimicrobiia bacterium]|nr:ExeM/NucH family extracellular endonuclease [Acidimicrobiia bacterium]